MRRGFAGYVIDTDRARGARVHVSDAFARLDETSADVHRDGAPAAGGRLHAVEHARSDGGIIDVVRIITERFDDVSNDSRHLAVHADV